MALYLFLPIQGSRKKQKCMPSLFPEPGVGKKNESISKLVIVLMLLNFTAVKKVVYTLNQPHAVICELLLLAET